MKTRPRTHLKSTLFLLLCHSPFFAGAAEIAELTFCHFGPKVKVFADTEKKCNGGAKIQAVAWECGASINVASKVDRFRKDLAERAKQECKKLCLKRGGPKCEGKFDFPVRCGLETDREEAIAAGKKFGCRSDCSGGKAMSYCSLYDAGYQTGDPEILSSLLANCHCISLEKSK